MTAKGVKQTNKQNAASKEFGFLLGCKDIQTPSKFFPKNGYGFILTDERTCFGERALVKTNFLKRG